MNSLCMTYLSWLFKWNKRFIYFDGYEKCLRKILVHFHKNVHCQNLLKVGLYVCRLTHVFQALVDNIGKCKIQDTSIFTMCKIPFMCTDCYYPPPITEARFCCHLISVQKTNECQSEIEYCHLLFNKWQKKSFTEKSEGKPDNTTLHLSTRKAESWVKVVQCPLLMSDQHYTM
jgi:hypothetical protein